MGFNNFIQRTTKAINSYFEPLRNPGFGGQPSDLTSSDVQNAIEEVNKKILEVEDSTIYPAHAQYNGNALVGRYLEYFSGLDSLDAPEVLPKDSKLDFATLRTDNTSGDFTVGIFELGDLVTPIASFTILDGVQTQIYQNINVLVSSLDELAIRVTSGSRRKPTFKLWINTGV